jgi:hypothetical protein
MAEVTRWLGEIPFYRKIKVISQSTARGASRSNASTVAGRRATLDARDVCLETLAALVPDHDRLQNRSQRAGAQAKSSLWAGRLSSLVCAEQRRARTKGHRAGLQDEPNRDQAIADNWQD